MSLLFVTHQRHATALRTQAGVPSAATHKTCPPPSTCSWQKRSCRRSFTRLTSCHHPGGRLKVPSSERQATTQQLSVPLPWVPAPPPPCSPGNIRDGSGCYLSPQTCVSLLVTVPPLGTTRPGTRAEFKTRLATGGTHPRRRCHSGCCEERVGQQTSPRITLWGDPGHRLLCPRRFHLRGGNIKTKQTKRSTTLPGKRQGNSLFTVLAVPGRETPGRLRVWIRPWTLSAVL